MDKNIDTRDISAKVMTELLTDERVKSYEMYEELESIHDSDEYDNDTLDKVLMTLTNYNFDEIKKMVAERVSGFEN